MTALYCSRMFFLINFKLIAFLFFLKCNQIVFCAPAEVFTIGSCNKPPYIGGAYFVDDGPFFKGGKVNYLCRKGYVFIGTSNERTCLENGNWTNVEFHCQLQDCGIPKFLRNGFVKYNSTVFGSRAEYSCKKGYNMISSGRNGHFRSCFIFEDFVRWTGEIPVCEIVLCPPPPVLGNASYNDFEVSEYSYMTKIEYTCDPGYKFPRNFDGEVLCDENGSWSRISACEVDYDCDFSRRKQSTFTCGYTNEQFSRKFVRSDCAGTPGYAAQANTAPLASLLSKPYNVSSVGACLKFCYRTTIPNDDQLVISVIPNTASFKSAKNYSASSLKIPENFWNKAQIDLEPGMLKWSFNIESSHNSLQLDDVTLETFACGPATSYQNLEHDSSSSSKAIASPTYINVQNEDHTSDPATSHTGYNLEFNSSDIAVNATYVAYPVDHSERVTAAVITDATSEAHSTAHTRACSRPSLMDGAIPDNSSDLFFPGFTIFYRCSNGYVLHGSFFQRTCLENGEWTEPTFRCLKLRCKVPFPPENGTVYFNNLSVGSEAKYTCKAGYRMLTFGKSKNIRRCVRSDEDSASWSGRPPLCEVGFCKSPKKIAHGFYNDYGASSYLIGAKIKYSCNFGYKFSRSFSGEVYCNENGYWDYTPDCELDYDCDFHQRTKFFACGYSNNQFRRQFVETDCNEREGFAAQSEKAADVFLMSNLYDVSPQGACLHFCYRITSKNDYPLLLTILSGKDSSVEKEVTISDGKLIGKSWRRKQISLESGLKRWSFKAESADNNIWIDEIKLEKSACGSGFVYTQQPISSTGKYPFSKMKKVDGNATTAAVISMIVDTEDEASDVSNAATTSPSYEKDDNSIIDKTLNITSEEVLSGVHNQTDTSSVLMQTDRRVSDGTTENTTADCTRSRGSYTCMIILFLLSEVIAVMTLV